MPNLKPGDFFTHPTLGACYFVDFNRSSSSRTLNCFRLEDGSKKEFLDMYVYTNCRPNFAVTIDDYINSLCFEEVFDNVTKSRASSYINADSIEIVSKAKDKVEAVVKGTSNYRTKIYTGSGSLKMDCSCPVSGKCKHLYALSRFLYITNEKTVKAPSETKVTNEVEKLFLEVNKSSGINYLEKSLKLINKCLDDKESFLMILKKYGGQFFYAYAQGGRPLYHNNETYDFIDVHQELSCYKDIAKLRKSVLNSLSARATRDDAIIYLFFNHRYTEALSNIPTTNPSLIVSSIAILSYLKSEQSIRLTETIAKINFNEKDCKYILEHIENEESKRLFYLLKRKKLGKSGYEIRLNAEELYLGFLNAPSDDRIEYFSSNYKEVLEQEKGDEYVLAMIIFLVSNTYLSFPNYKKLMKVINELNDNEILKELSLKANFKDEDNLDSEGGFYGYFY